MKTALLLLSALVCACDASETTGANCPDVARAGIVVTPIDARTSTVTTANGFVFAREGSYVDSARAGQGLTQIGVAYERKGKYSVSAKLDGYRTWTQNDVVVTQGECGVIPVSLAALLIPE